MEQIKNPLAVDRQDRPRYVSEMFARIAGRYDLMNTLMTGGFDRGWRTLATEMVTPSADVWLNARTPYALDLAAGTGELAFTVADEVWCAGVVAIDLCWDMLAVAQEKLRGPRFAAIPCPVHLVTTDSLDLPFADDSFVAATVGFGVRNFADLPRAFREIRRVLAPGAKFACLELTRSPNSNFNKLFDVYFDRVVPWMGGLVAGDPEAYTYLPGSVKAFPPARELARLMAEAGWRDVRFRRLGMGTVALHLGTK